MNLKMLRDYLNSLNLDEVQDFVEIVYHCEGSTVCEELGHFQLNIASAGLKPYLSFYADSFMEELEKDVKEDC